MSDPTRTNGPPSEPVEDRGATRNAPPTAEPGTATAGTHTHASEPPTATGPRAEAPSEPVLAPPGFEIMREIGSGGMGVVFEARQSRLNRLVALKVLRYGRGDAKDVLRFLTEAEAVAAVRHPHVVQVYEFGQHDGRPFMVLELLAGGTLSDRLKDGKRLDPRDAAELVAKLAGAVQAMHDLGIVHRDLKPSNVLFSDSSPKITDFGLAKRAGGTDLTKTQAVMGTPAYMAPEQAKGNARFVGPPADIYALGVILYECLAGKRPFDAADSWAILQQVIHADPPAPRVHVADVPRDLELIALKCLEKNPADRYPSAAALADDLTRFLAGKPVSVRSAGLGERFVKWVKRNPVVAGFSTALALVALVGFVLVTLATLDARDRARDLARSNSSLNSALVDLTEARDGLSGALGDAKAARDNAEARGYLSDVALAHQLWKANDLAGMRTVLERCPPARRKWEWHYLAGLSRPQRAVYETDSLPLALAYSPDGKLLAYLTLDGTLTIQDLAAGTVRSWPRADEPTTRRGSLAFHPGGKEVAYVTGGRVWVLDLTTGKLRELDDPKHPPGNPGNRSGSPSVAVGYTTDGQLLAAAHTRGDKPGSQVFIIRDANMAKPIATLPGYEKPEGMIVELAGAAFSPDAKKFAASVIDSGIRVQAKGDLQKNEPFYPMVMVWDAASGKQLWKGEGGSALLGDLAFTNDGKSVVFGRGRRVLNTMGGNGHFAFDPGHVGDVLAVAFGSKSLVWSGGDDRLIRGHYHTLPPKDEQFILRGCPKGVVRLTQSPDGKELAAAVGELFGGRGAVYRFDIAALNSDSWRATGGRYRASFVTALSSDAARFAACDFAIDREGTEAGRFLIHEIAGGAERDVRYAGVHFRSAFRPDGGLLVLDRNNRVQLIGPDGKQTGEFTVAEDHSTIAPALIACTPNGRTAAAVSAARSKGDGKSNPNRRPLTAQLVTRDLETNRAGVTAEVDLSAEFPPEAQGMLFPAGASIDSNGTRIAASFVTGWQVANRARIEFRGVLLIWDLNTGKEVFRRTCQSPLYAVAFDPQGHIVAAGGDSSGGVVMGWNLNNNDKAGIVLAGHSRPILCLAFGPDGRLATGGADRVVKLWDTATGQEILTFDGFAREVTHLAFTKDGANLVAGTGLELLTMVSSVGMPADWPPAEVRVFRAPK